MMCLYNHNLNLYLYGQIHVNQKTREMLLYAINLKVVHP